MSRFAIAGGGGKPPGEDPVLNTAALMLLTFAFGWFAVSFLPLVHP